jgi:hypothetical protein
MVKRTALRDQARLAVTRRVEHSPTTVYMLLFNIVGLGAGFSMTPAYSRGRGEQQQ